MQGIYIIKCLINNRVYVGQSTNIRNRINAHRCALRNGMGVQKLQVDWDSYNETDFEFIVITECNDKNKRNELEKYYIQQYNAIEYGYNTNTGGIGQGNFKYLNGMYGKHHTEQSKLLMSKNLVGKRLGSLNPNYGKHLSESTKLKISNANKGRVMSDEERARRSISMRNANSKPENIEKRNKRVNDPKYQQKMKEIGVANRKYSDEFIKDVRDAYVTNNDIRQLAELYSMPFKTCMEMVHRNGHFKNR